MKGKSVAKKSLKKSLVIVESPTKVKTIQKYLDSSYIVKASMGHVRDLPKSKLGVDEKKSFKPDYRVLPAKKKILDELKKAAEKADSLYIATDPDREGEAIGWHLAQELGMPKAKTYRIMFNEITERAVKAAFLHPGKIDAKKVDAQQARRVLDRLVGYKLSPLLWQKIRRGLSAGRVQSVAVRLITEREREIQAFVSTEYWSLHARLKGKNPPEFIAALREVKGEKASLPSEVATLTVMKGLHGAVWKVKSVTRGERRRNPAAPFITSTLQQEGSRKLHFTAKKTMMLAQQLYEGIELGAKARSASSRICARTPCASRARPRTKHGSGSPRGSDASISPTIRPRTRPRRARRRPTRRSGRAPSRESPRSWGASSPRTSSRSTA